MFVVINALKSITRSKGRNVLIGMIVLAIAASSCVALSIRAAADEARTIGLSSLKITAAISVDRQRLMEDAASSAGSGRPDPTVLRELMEKYQDLPLSELLGKHAVFITTLRGLGYRFDG